MRGRINDIVGHHWFVMNIGLKQVTSMWLVLFNIFFGEVFKEIMNRLDEKGIETAYNEF